MEQFKFEITIGYVLLLFVLNISCSIFNLKNLFYLFVVFGLLLLWGGGGGNMYFILDLTFVHLHGPWGGWGGGGGGHFLFGDFC